MKQLKKNYEKINEELAYIIGVMIGDGYITIDWRRYIICLNTIDKDFAKYFLKNLEKTFGIKGRIRIEKTKYCKQGFRYRSRISSKEAYNFIKEKKENVVPLILKSPKKYQIKFLEGAFDSEGGVNKDKNSKRIDFNMHNKNIINLVSKLLTNLKIENHLYISKSRKKPYYNLYICGRKNLTKFHKLIHFSIKRKEDELKNLLNSYIN